jgi:hypothetical protein
MWARLAAGLVAGFFLAAALVGLVSWAWPGPWQRTLVPALLTFVPVWVAVICLGLRFANGRRAWAWLGGLAIAGLGVLRALQSAGWVR